MKAPDLATAIAVTGEAKISPDGLLVDYHLDDGSGITAILITADRSPQVREEARVNGVQVLNKPVKPAALRALLTQWRMQRVVAAE